jgi:hypothetical protein
LIEFYRDCTIGWRVSGGAKTATQHSHHKLRVHGYLFLSGTEMGTYCAMLLQFDLTMKEGIKGVKRV